MLSWVETLWGYQRQLIGRTDVISIAEDRLRLGSNDSMELELAGLVQSEHQQAIELLRVLSSHEPNRLDRLPDKTWLFLVLAWLFENREAVSDPLDEVESIYADFDYPPEIEGFVRYMPVTNEHDTLEHSAEDNQTTLFSKWEEYLLTHCPADT